MLWIIKLTLYTALINGQNTLDIFSRNSFIFFFIVLFDRLWFICYWFDVMKFKNALIRFNVFCSVCMYFNILSWPISTVCENQVYHFLLSEKVKKFCFLPVFVILVLILMGFFSTLKPNLFEFFVWWNKNFGFEMVLSIFFS